MEWGGAWKSFQDRPHVEWHPGFDAGQSKALLDDYKAGGLQDAWGELEKPEAAPVGPMSFNDPGTKLA